LPLQDYDPAALDELDVSLPAPLWPPAARRRCELEALVACAGPIAEGVAGREEPPLPADYVPPSPVERMLEQVTVLSKSERAELESGDADLPELDDDTKVAYDAAYLLAGCLGVRAQLELLQAQTIDLLQQPRVLRLVRVLADELIRHETLGGADVCRVLEPSNRQSARGKCGLRETITIEPWPVLRCTQVAP
jgi:hypothetical protein